MRDEGKTNNHPKSTRSLIYTLTQHPTPKNRFKLIVTPSAN
jgi:hypothetical protein